jgi:3-hydroxybutyryl-CoA dehydrogenase
MQMLCLAQESLIEAGLISSREGEAARKRVALHSSLTDACDGMQLLVETVTEDLNVKKAVLEATDRLCPRRAIFASNTSGLCQ